MSRIRPLAVMVVLATAAWVGAAAGIVETIRERYGKAGTIATDFDLTILWKVREKRESRSGRLRLAPGDKFRVELGATTWICNGQTVWQYSSTTNQVVIRRLLDIDLASHPSQILATYVNGYPYRVLQETPAQAVLGWQADSTTPQQRLYSSIALHYDKRKGAISSVVVTDRHGNVSTYEFRKTVFGGALGNEVFEFDAPKGVEVLDERN